MKEESTTLEIKEEERLADCRSPRSKSPRFIQWPKFRTTLAEFDTTNELSVSNSRFNVSEMTDDQFEKHHKVDMELVNEGLRLIAIAETEIPSIKILKTHNQNEKPLTGAFILGSTHITAHYAVLINTLIEFGATVRWNSCNIYSTQKPVAAALAYKGVPLFCEKYKENHKYHNFEKCLIGNKSFLPNIIIDDSGDFSIYVKEYHFHIFSKIKGIIENSLFDVPRIYEIFQNDNINLPILNVSASFVQKRIRDSYNYNIALLECIRIGKDTIISGCTAIVFGYGNRGSRIAKTLKNNGALVYIIEIDPICAFKAGIDGFKVASYQSVASQAHIVITCTGNLNVLDAETLSLLRNNALVLNMGNCEAEINVESLYNDEENIKVKSVIDKVVDEIIFSDGKKIILLAQGKHAANACCTVPTKLFAAATTTLAVATLELFLAPPTRYKPGMYILPKKMDEYVSSLFLPSLHCILTRLTSEQTDFLGVNINGPYKPHHYKY